MTRYIRGPPEKVLSPSTKDPSKWVLPGPLQYRGRPQSSLEKKFLQALSKFPSKNYYGPHPSLFFCSHTDEYIHFHTRLPSSFASPHNQPATHPPIETLA